MLPVVITPVAHREFFEIVDHLEERSPAAAQRLSDTFAHQCRLLGQLPGIGRMREEFGAGLRSLVIEKYVLFYRAFPDRIEVVHILHGSRDIAALFKRETLD